MISFPQISLNQQILKYSDSIFDCGNYFDLRMYSLLFILYIYVKFALVFCSLL